MTEQEKGNLHQISTEIGALKASVEMLMRIWQTQEAAATAGRRSLYEKFELFRQEVGVQIASLGLRVDRMSDAFNLVEPSMQSFKDEKLRKEGAERLGIKLYGALIACAGAFGWGVHEFFSWWKHP